MSDLRPIGDLVAEWMDTTPASPPAASANAPNPRVEAALLYARCFGPIWPQSPQKTGYRGTHGAKDATRDAAALICAWQEHPEALPALLTGRDSGIVVADVDIKNGVDGRDTLELFGISTHPYTMTAHSPSGGFHLFFKWPGKYTKSGKLGDGLEVKADNAWITLPPGPRRFFDPHLGLDTPLAAMPAWMMVVIAEPVPKSAPKPTRDIRLSRYGESALDGAVKAIISAPAGQQHEILNRECFAIGGLVAVGVIPANLALESLGWAARQMPSYDRRRSWRIPELDKQVKNSFLDGQLHPRAVPA